MILREFCAEGLCRVPEAIAAGARRVELCAHLDLGGLTPSAETIRQAVNYCHPLGVPIMVMVRCRGGNFFYTDAEFEEMKDSIALARRLGADGVVCGAIDASMNVDERVALLVAVAEGMSLTFHMAFDVIPFDKQFHAIDMISAYGFHRILTHGGPLGTAVEGNLDRLAELVSYANNRISIMPGGGVTAFNCEAVARHTGVNEVHGTRIVALL